MCGHDFPIVVITQLTGFPGLFLEAQARKRVYGSGQPSPRCFVTQLKTVESKPKIIPPMARSATMPIAINPSSSARSTLFILPELVVSQPLSDLRAGQGSMTFVTYLRCRRKVLAG